MKKIAIAAALLMATAVASQAAPMQKSPYCKFANSQRNPVAWNAYYHCLQTSGATRAHAHAAAPARHREAAKDPYCKFASAQRNQVSWNAYYHCLGR